MKRFTVYFTNHGYRSQESFDSVDEAKAYVRRCFFEAHIEDNGESIIVFTIFGGFRQLARLA
jgi:hypothetical protein